MPMCQAIFCSNRPEKCPGKSFFAIPNPLKERERCAIWLRNLGTTKLNIKTYEYSKSRVVCEDHFEPTAFEEDRQAIYLGYKPRKILKFDAVPTKFKHRNYGQGDGGPRPATFRRECAKSMRKEILSACGIDPSSKSEKVQDNSPVTSRDHKYARVEAAVSRGDQAVSRDDQAVSRDEQALSRDEQAVSRNNHAVFKAEPEVCRDEQASGCTGNEHVSVPATIDQARTSIAEDPEACDLVALSMEVETAPTTEESHRVLPLSTLVQNTSSDQENVEQMSRLKRLKLPGRPQIQGIVPKRQLTVDADVYVRWCSMARQLGVTPRNLAPILLDAAVACATIAGSSLEIHCDENNDAEIQRNENDVESQ